MPQDKGMCYYLAESYLNSKVRDLDVALRFQRDSVHRSPDVFGCSFYFYVTCWRDFYPHVISGIIALQIFSTIENMLVLVCCLNRN